MAVFSYLNIFISIISVGQWPMHRLLCISPRGRAIYARLVPVVISGYWYSSILREIGGASLE